MNQGHLSEYFDGLAAKRLSMVEADFTKSHQHEFQAVRAMVDVIGRASNPTSLSARFLYLTDEEPALVVENASLTLYDSRRLKPLRAPEYRFYFTDNEVTSRMTAGDLLVIAKLRAGGLLVIIAENRSSIASQVEWLFGLEDLPLPGLPGRGGFEVRSELNDSKDRIGYAERIILENIGVEVEATNDGYLDLILGKFGSSWPETRDFSPFARSLAPEVSALDDPDDALVRWVDLEYVLYRTLEKHLISERLDKGFSGPSGVDDFLHFSLSVQNRRKSRSGSSLEHHLEEILKANGVHHVRGAKTESHSTPDFLFPGLAEYQDANFPSGRLHMLASKRSAKDRWRQILAEAERIRVKHLLTLEVAISRAQTDEMERQNVRLVLPAALHETFTEAQRPQLTTFREFIHFVKSAQ